MVTTFVLLGLSIVLVWFPPSTLHMASGVRPWMLAFAAAVVAGLAAGVLTWPALASLGALAGALWAANRPMPRWCRQASTMMAVLIGLTLALHLLPGFNNPVVINAVAVSAGAPPMTQYANFDKGAAGLLFLAAYSRRITGRAELPHVAAVSAVALIGTAAVTFGVGLAIGAVRIDPKLPEVALTFLLVNLLFTCVAEEAFFRGFLQERLTLAVADERTRRWLPVIASATLFGVAHAAGGPVMVGLASVAGLGYAASYAATRRIEAPILVHFAVNGTQFLLFTYPYLPS